MNGPRPLEIDRENNTEHSYDRPCLFVSSVLCDVTAICCVAPCIIINPISYACTGMFYFTRYQPPQKKKSGFLGNWYRASIFSLNQEYLECSSVSQLK